jgi:hypothetical protein
VKALDAGRRAMTLRADLNAAREKLAQATGLLRAAQAAHADAASALESAIEQAVEGGFNSLSTAPGPVCLHTREHRPGRPSRIDSNSDLRAFVLARIDRMTFTALADEIARHFPPRQRVGKSALHEWFHKNKPESHPR